MAHNRDAHNLNGLTSYEVIQTIKDGQRIEDREMASPDSYIVALDEARAIRAIPGCWAVVYGVYADGCRTAGPF